MNIKIYYCVVHLLPQQRKSPEFLKLFKRDMALTLGHGFHLKTILFCFKKNRIRLFFF
jgi:hypothetical protein